MAIDDYAYTLFNKWEIGGETYRGLLVLMAVGDDNYYVMPGTAVSDSFDSASIGKLMDEYLEPDFAQKNYDAAAKSFFEAAYAKMADDLNLDLSVSDAVADYEAFIRENGYASSDASVEIQPVVQEVSRGGSGSALPVILIMVLALFIILRSSGRSVRTSSRSSTSSLLTGFMLGRMSASDRRRSAPGPFGMPQTGFRPQAGRRSSSSHSARPGGFSASGSVNRSSSVRTSRSGGFGGAGRSGGASRGPSTRGGGAGRFSRR